MKHKHAELIKAWADGAVIQAKYNQTWVDMSTPQWDENSIRYRIKPEQPVVRWKWAYQFNTFWYESEQFFTEEEVQFVGNYIKLEYTRQEFPDEYKRIRER
jgi:hypothetical protein